MIDPAPSFSLSWQKVYFGAKKNVVTHREGKGGDETWTSLSLRAENPRSSRIATRNSLWGSFPTDPVISPSHPRRDDAGTPRAEPLSD